MEVGKRNLREKAAEDERDNIMQQENIERGVQNDAAMKLKVKAASDDLIGSLNAQVRDHTREAAKRQMEEKAYCDKVTEAMEEARLKEEEAKNVAKTKQQVYAADLLQQIEDNKKRRERERKLNM